MPRLPTRFDALMMAVTFAEAGEPGTALEFLKEPENKRSAPPPLSRPAR
ncbi:MAG: hypothetical protein H7841_06960 [Magnetospirillum sp. WYHS-4]